MPLKTTNTEPPEAMTWGKATPVIIVSVVFDALRLMFEMFWFFGPAIAAAYCTVKTSNAVIGTGALCTGAAATAGFFGAGVIEVFGIVMAIAVGLAGWLAIGLYLMTENPRIFKENALWFAGSLLISEMPIIGSIPALSVIVWKMYNTQIRVEKAALKKWGAEQAAARTREQQQRQAAEQAQRMQKQAANDEEEIPEDLRKAA